MSITEDSLRAWQFDPIPFRVTARDDAASLDGRDA